MYYMHIQVFLVFPFCLFSASVSVVTLEIILKSDE